jgi:hypothetical protein
MNFDDVDLAIIAIGTVLAFTIWKFGAISTEIVVGGITAIAALARGKPNNGVVAPPPTKPPETP